MKKNIDNFKIFYLSFLGKAISNILSQKISDLWKPINNSRVAAIGFCSPYLKSINKKTKTISLYEFIKKNKIKEKIILKIDVDGFEIDVIKSLQIILKKKI